MRKMKDSGVAWIGDIPEDWRSCRIKIIFDERKEVNNPIITDNILSLTMEKGIILYEDKEGGGNKAKEDLSLYRITREDDIVVNSMNIVSGAVGISQYFGCLSPVYYPLIIRDKKNHCANYFYYLFKCNGFQKSLLGLGNGILYRESENGTFNTVRLRIPMSKLNCEIFPVASLKAQQLIADFLDKKCESVDKLIALQEDMIRELKEYKQSVITEAVTKGLDKTAPMKDSGIEWIGQIPESWKVGKLKNLCEICNGQDYKDVFDENGQFPIVGSGGIFSSASKFLYNKKSVLLGRKGTIDKPLFLNRLFGR